MLGQEAKEEIKDILKHGALAVGWIICCTAFLVHGLPYLCGLVSSFFSS